MACHVDRAGSVVVAEVRRAEEVLDPPAGVWIPAFLEEVDEALDGALGEQELRTKAGVVVRDDLVVRHLPPRRRRRRSCGRRWRLLSLLLWPSLPLLLFLFLALHDVVIVDIILDDITVTAEGTEVIIDVEQATL